MRFWWLLALLSWHLVLAAPNAVQVRLEQAIGNGSEISLYLDARRADDSPVAATELGGMDVHLDGQAAAVESVVDFADSGEGVAYIFLVDTSKSLNNQAYENIRGALSSWIQAMNEEDMAAIIGFGTGVERLSGFTRDRDLLESAVARLGPRDDWTHLFLGLKEAMDLGAGHRTDPGVPGRKLIVILSDGDNDLPRGEVGLTLQETEDMIRTTRIPIQGIAFNAKPAGLQIMGKLARLSGGSLLQTSNQAHIAGSYANLRIRINQAIVARARCDACPQDGGLYPLVISFADGTSVPGDLKVRMSPARTTAPVPEPDQVPASATAPDQEDTTEGLPVEGPAEEETTWIADWRLWAGIGILIALAAAGIAWIGTRRQKGVAAPAPESAPEPAPPPPPIVRSSIGRQPDTVHRGVPPAMPLSPGGKRARLTVISGAAPKGQMFEVQVAETVLLGRSDECQVSIPGDEEVSRRHARLDVKSDWLVITDMSSTHGTYVNGVPVHGERLLEDGDILRLGRTELHLSF